MAKCIDDLFTGGVYSSSTPQTDSFQQNLIRWCDEVRYTPEYDNRVIAVEKMLICRNNHEALLTLSNLGLTELPSFLKYLLPHLTWTSGKSRSFRAGMKARHELEKKVPDL